MKRIHVPLAAMLAAASLAATAMAVEPDHVMTRQERVAQKGAKVMPFDLARTTHFFDDMPTGGIETVTADSKRDGGQIGLIRAHLATEAGRFSHGDFSDPARIHGNDMPGLATLAAAGDKLRVTYKSVPTGASLTYASNDAAVVAAIHAWFAAQRFDHGAHAHMHMAE